jgi:hypothetical protein
MSEPGDQRPASTRTKKISLNRSDTTTGGGIIMPMDISTEATTRSMIQNGRNSRKPISKARLSSEIIKAGTKTHIDTSSELFRPSLARHVHEQLQVLVADVLLHEVAQRSLARSNASLTVISLAPSGLTPVS